DDRRAQRRRDVASVIRLHTSLRAATPEQTLAKARRIASELGIARVCDVTRLDRIGVPVFASIRPESPIMCVNAGKSLTGAEAAVSAYMEAIEFALAEPGAAPLPIVRACARDVLGG